MSTPDYNTINRFRSEKLKEPLKKIFVQVVQLLAAEGLLSIKELYTDGTKIEANLPASKQVPTATVLYEVMPLKPTKKK